MMFQKLATMMKQGDSLAISAAMQPDGRMLLTVHAMGDFKNKALATPLSMVGTPEELDAEMADELGRWVGTRMSLREQIDAANLILEAARKETASAASKATQRPAAGKAKAVGAAKPATAGVAAGDADETDDDDASGGGEGGEAGAVGGPKEGAPEVSGEQAAVNLFGS